MLYFSKNCSFKAEAYPGIKECIEALKKKGAAFSCITNKSKEIADAPSVFPGKIPFSLIWEMMKNAFKPDKTPLLVQRSLILRKMKR